MEINFMSFAAQIERANSEQYWTPTEHRDREGLEMVCDVLNISRRTAKGAYRLYKRFYKKNPAASITYEMKVFRTFLNLLDYHRPKIGFNRSNGVFARKCGHEVSDGDNGWFYHPTLGVIRFSK